METVRDRIINTICGYLVMAGVLLPSEVADYMRYLNGISREELAFTLVQSKVNYQKALELDSLVRRN